MKWFKHMSDLSRDEDVAKMMDESGRDQLAIYGFFNLVMEHIAEKMKAGQPSDCSITYSLSRWARIAGTNRQRAIGLLKKLSANRAVSVEVASDTCTVSMPQLLVWRDEYSRRSGHTPDKVAQSRTEQKRTEQRESRQDNSLSDCLKAGTQGRCAPPNFEVTKVLQEWATINYPSVSIEKESAKFKRWEFPKPRNDWDATWKTWIQWAAEYQERKNGSSDPPNATEELLKLGKVLGMERQSGESETEYLDRVTEINQRRIDGLTH